MTSGRDMPIGKLLQLMRKGLHFVRRPAAQAALGSGELSSKPFVFMHFCHTPFFTENAYLAIDVLRVWYAGNFSSQRSRRDFVVSC